MTKDNYLKKIETNSNLFITLKEYHQQHVYADLTIGKKSSQNNHLLIEYIIKNTKERWSAEDCTLFIDKDFGYEYLNPICCSGLFIIADLNQDEYLMYKVAIIWLQKERNIDIPQRVINLFNSDDFLNYTSTYDI